VEGFVCVGKLDDFKEGEMKECISENENFSVLISRELGQLYATGTKCTHYGASLKSGILCNGRIRCPWHGACFSIVTGDIEDFPAFDPLPIYEVKLTDNEDVFVRTTPINPLIQGLSLSDPRTFVIIGGGGAGFTCAETLRKEGFDGRILLISKENHLPYDRPKLSKNFNTSVDKILLKPETFYLDNQIELKLNVEVIELDVDTKSIKTNFGEIINYDKCLVATGGRPQLLPFIDGHDAQNIYPLRTPEDCSIINSVVDGKNVVIVGSSFIGMETASCIGTRASSITVIGMENVPFERVLGSFVGSVLQKYHEGNGIKFILNAIVSRFEKQGNICNNILLKDGRNIEAEIIILGAGIIPCTSFIKQSPNLKMGQDKSIIVNEYLYAGVDGLYAAGDIARYPYRFGETVRIEHWGMAQTQGMIVAKNMLLDNTIPCNNIPFFWTIQFGKAIRYTGHALKYEDVIVDLGDEVEINYKNPKFAAYYIHNGVAVAICTMNMDPICSLFSEILNKGILIEKSEIEKSISETKSSERALLLSIKRV